MARRQPGASVAGAGRRGIRVHARAPAGTLCRRAGGAWAGERAAGGGAAGSGRGGAGGGGGAGGAVAGERAGERARLGAGSAAAATLGAAWVPLVARLLQPASCLADQQAAVEARRTSALLPGGRP